MSLTGKSNVLFKFKGLQKREPRLLKEQSFHEPREMAGLVCKSNADCNNDQLICSNFLNLSSNKRECLPKNLPSFDCTKERGGKWVLHWDQTKGYELLCQCTQPKIFANESQYADCNIVKACEKYDVTSAHSITTLRCNCSFPFESILWDQEFNAEKPGPGCFPVNFFRNSSDPDEYMDLPKLDPDFINPLYKRNFYNFASRTLPDPCRVDPLTGQVHPKGISYATKVNGIVQCNIAENNHNYQTLTFATDYLLNNNGSYPNAVIKIQDSDDLYEVGYEITYYQHKFILLPFIRTNQLMSNFKKLLIDGSQTREDESSETLDEQFANDTYAHIYIDSKQPSYYIFENVVRELIQKQQLLCMLPVPIFFITENSILEYSWTMVLMHITRSRKPFYLTCDKPPKKVEEKAMRKHKVKSWKELNEKENIFNMLAIPPVIYGNNDTLIVNPYINHPVTNRFTIRSFQSLPEYKILVPHFDSRAERMHGVENFLKKHVPVKKFTQILELNINEEHLAATPTSLTLNNLYQPSGADWSIFNRQMFESQPTLSNQLVPYTPFFLRSRLYKIKLVDLK